MAAAAEWNGEVEEERWLKPLLRESFFGQCEQHAHSQCNMFCLECVDRPICSLCCVGNHKGHHVIQTYIINSARVVFLNQRPQPRPGKGVTNTCLVCDRSLLDTFSFCSLGCKINADTSTRRGCQGSKKRVSSHPPSKTSSSGEKKMKRFSPSTPPPTTYVNYRTAKRRKGIPHRAVLMA